VALQVLHKAGVATAAIPPAVFQIQVGWQFIPQHCGGGAGVRVNANKLGQSGWLKHAKALRCKQRRWLCRSRVWAS
jgi:hypothetical protein